jgi:hypothetical protein
MCVLGNIYFSAESRRVILNLMYKSILLGGKIKKKKKTIWIEILYGGTGIGQSSDLGASKGV